MNSSTALRCSLLLVTFLLLTSPAWSQVDDLTRTPVPGIGHDFIDDIMNETVNPENGSLNIRIAPPLPGGRGVNVPFSFNYNTSDLNIPRDNLQLGDTSPFRFTVQFGRAGEDGGWQYTLPKLSARQETREAPPQDDGDWLHICTYYDNYQFTDATGGQHRLGLVAAPIQSWDCVLAGGPTGPQGYGWEEQVDSTMDAPSVDFNSAVTVSDIAGTTYRMDGFSPTTLPDDPLIYEMTATSVEDRNGNKISISTSPSISNTHFENFAYTDSLGRTLLSKTSTTQTTDVLSVVGTANNYTVQWQAVPFNEPAPNANLLGTGCQVAAASSAYTAVQSISLPNSQQYRFEYDPTTGFVSRIFYPTGGWIRYTWGWNPNSHAVEVPYLNLVGVPPQHDEMEECAGLFDNFAITKREVSFDGTNVALVQTYAYSTIWPTTWLSGWGVWDTKTTTVTSCDALRNPSALTSCNASNATAQEIHVYKTYGSNFPTEETLISEDGAGTVLRTVKKTFKTEKAMTDEQVTLANGLTSLTHYVYDNCGSGYPDVCKLQVAEEDKYDWGSGQPGPLLRQTLTNYQSIVTPTHGIIHNLPTSVTVVGADGYIKAQTIYSYDNTTLLPDLGGAPQHDDTNFSTAYTARGNLTQVQQWLYPGNSYITNTTNYYDDLGNLRQTTDGNNNSTYFDYSDDFPDWSCLIPNSSPQAWVTQRTNALGQSTQSAYYGCTGLLVWHRDQNDINANRVNASFTYDGMGRVSSVSYADGGHKSYFYQDTPSFNAPYVQKNLAIDSSTNTASWTQVDGLGRIIRTAKLNGATNPDGTPDVSHQVDDVDTCYDGLGRKSFVTYPYQMAGWQPGTYHCPPDAATPPGDSFSYDALGRVTRVTHSDGSHVDTDYSQFPRVLVTDEAGKQRLSQTDARGRLIAVWEPDNNGNLNWYTGYQYDTLDNLTFVNQIGGDPANARQRFFQYDSLSRLISATNPESGTITYAYDNAGNLTTKTAPAPNQQDLNVTVTTYYYYDALNRLTSKGFSDSSQGVGFVYDQTPLWGVAVQNPVGRLVGSYVWRNGLPNSVGSVLSYDVMGRANYENHFNGHAATWLNEIFNYNYNLDGSLNWVQYPTGRKITYHYNMAQRPDWAKDLDNGINYVTGARYTASGTLSSLVNGSTTSFAGITTSNSYNARMQPVYLSASSLSGTIFNLGYDFHLGSNDNGNVYAINNNRILDHGRDQSFTYDQLNRLVNAQNAGTDCTQHIADGQTKYWGESYGYDAWGNLTGRNVTKCSAEGSVPTANNKNQMSGYNYDAAGNLWMWGWNYDDGNRLIAAPLANLSFDYDPQGRRVEKSSGTLYWYDVGGRVLEETNLSGGSKAEYIFFRGRRIARRDPSGAVHYYFADRLGSTDIVTNATGGVESENEVYPFGGDRIILDSGIGNNYKFTGKERDPEDGLDNFGARYYTWYFSRFTTPDESWIWQDPSDPQQWNLYSYVRNNPTSNDDPDGHDCVYLNDAGNAVESIDQNSNPRECGKSGGYWVNGAVTNAQMVGNWLFLTGTTNGRDNNTHASYRTDGDVSLSADAQRILGMAYLRAGGAMIDRYEKAAQKFLRNPVVGAYLSVIFFASGEGGAEEGGAEAGAEAEGAEAGAEEGADEAGEEAGQEEIPGRPYTGPNAARDAFKHLEKYHGVDPIVASERLHQIKEHAGLGPADNAIIGRTGDVYNPYTGEYIGSLTQK